MTDHSNACKARVISFESMLHSLKHRLRNKLALCVTTLLCINAALACSPAPPALFKGLDTDEYIFYGQVTGYTALKTPFCELLWVGTRECATAWGVEMSVVGAVQLPRPDVTGIQYYRFGHRGDCSRIPMDREQSMKQFPIGTVYKVIAHPLRVIEEPAQSGLQLLDGSGLSKSLLIPIPPGKDIAALQDAKADYSPAGGYQFDAFEFKKDLVRLHTARSQQQAIEPLMRLADFSWLPGAIGTFGPETYMNLVRQYVTDAQSIAELQKRYDAAIKVSR